MSNRMIVSLFLLFLLPFTYSSGPYKPDWDSLDKRPLPDWFDRAKVGIFLHWGVFSVPGVGSEWFWWQWKGDKPSNEAVDFVKNNFPPGWSYQDFAKDFKAELFDPKEWARIFKDSGARYVVLTSKHHEGFTLWPSNSSWGWNAKDVGPKRDLVGELGAAVRSQGIKYGLYHSLFEWFNPLFLKDKESGFQTNTFVEEKTMPELYDLVQNYRPEVIWSDGDWNAVETYWKSKEFLAWLYNESPVKDTVVVNDRWGLGTSCKHGDFLNCADRYRPGKLQAKKWENCMTIDRNSWGFVRKSSLKDYYTIHELVSELIETVAFGGNILINVGPTPDGRIEPLFEERLVQLGNWLGVNGEAIYDSIPWKSQNDSVTPGVYYTQSRDKRVVYSHFLSWPKDNQLHLHSLPVQANLSVSLLKGPTPVSVVKGKEGETVVDLRQVDRFISQDVAFVLKIVGLSQ